MRMSTQNPRVRGSNCDPCGSENVTKPQGKSPPAASLPFPEPPGPLPVPAAAVPFPASDPASVLPFATSQMGFELDNRVVASAAECVARIGGRAADRPAAARAGLRAGLARLSRSAGIRAGAGVGAEVGRIVTRRTCACVTISRRVLVDQRLDGMIPAAISCSAIETANATANRRAFECPKKTPSRSREKGSASGRRFLLRVGVVCLDVPLPELVVGRIVAVFVVEPVTIGVLSARHFLLFRAFFTDFVVVVDD